MDAVIAFDVGTTRLKWIMRDMASGTNLWSGQTRVPTQESGPQSEQDPGQIWRMVEDVVAKTRDYGAVRRVSFSAAMHSFLAVDGRGRPLTQVWTWMDTRAADVAQRMRQSPMADNLRRLTGVPIHSMSPLMKWLLVRSQLPADAFPVSLKDYLIYQLTGLWMTDYSTASASGFLGLEDRWLDQALDLAQLEGSRMPRLAQMDQRLPMVGGQAEVVLGGSDAATAHYHLKIPADGTVGVLAMGTSGALRVTSKHSVVDPALFCYTMGPGKGFLVGSAFSNAGNVIQWLSDLFGLSINAVIEQGIRAIRSQRKLPGAVPYWQGERSPWWREALTGTWSEMGPGTTASDLAGSTILAMTASYWDGLRTLRRVGEPTREIRAGSRLMESPAMGQWMADALGQDIVLYDQRDASLLGAFDVAMEEHQNKSTAEVHRFCPQANFEDRMAHEWERIQISVQRMLPT